MDSDYSSALEALTAPPTLFKIVPFDRPTVRTLPVTVNNSGLIAGVSLPFEIVAQPFRLHKQGEVTATVIVLVLEIAFY